MIANNYDAKEREQALDITNSYIVQAPAGSGKTELLIQRFLKLLANVQSPNEVIAITFTKKAAHEMRERVINALKNALYHPVSQSHHQAKTFLLAKQVLEKDKKLNWNLLDNPNQLRIQTIDSLCVYLAQQLPLLSHFGSQPKINEYPIFLYQETIKEVLLHLEENLPWSKDLADVLLYLDNNINNLNKLLVTLLAKRDQWLPYIHFYQPTVEIKSQFEKYLQQVIVEHLTQAKHLFPKPLIPELLTILQFIAKYTTDKDSPLLHSKLDSLPSAEIHCQTTWNTISNILLKKDGCWRTKLDHHIGLPTLKTLSKDVKKIFTEYNARFTDFIQHLVEQENLRFALAAIPRLPESFYDDKQWHILQSLLHILKIVCAQLRVTFQQQGTIDFIENTLAALTALGTEDRPTDLVMSLDYQIQHILIDEFQDTSFTHYQFLTKLISGWEPHDGRTLFVVGDPMQSIYRFREAEVSLFIRLWQQGIGNLKLIPLSLTMNFRSTKNIINWNNHHYQKIFPTKNDIANGAISYSPSVCQDRQDNNHSEIYIKGFKDTPTNIQADTIIQLLARLRIENLNDKIAILVRTRTNLKYILPALKKAKIAYQAIDIDPLSSRQSIQDLVSLTCALLNPGDRLAWFSILRAPWCGLTLNDLLLLTGENTSITIFEQLNNPKIINSLSLDGQNRLNKIIPILKQKISERERHSLRYWVETTWLLLGGPASLNDELELLDVSAYFDILDEFNQNNQFINQEILIEKVKQLSALAKPCEHLQIMTIHAAKGLEFDTVIIPHLEFTHKHEDKAILNWIEKPLLNGQNALLLAPIHETGEDENLIYEYIREQHKIKLDHEINRLLYVATTRAKKNLYLFFNIKSDEQPKSGSFLKKLWPAIEDKIDQLIDPVEGMIQDSKDILKEQPLYRFTPEWKNIITDSNPVRVYYHQQTSGFQLVSQDKKYIGLIIHQILQLMTQLGTTWWSDKNFTERKTYVQFQLRQFNLNRDSLDEVSQKILLYLQNTLSDARGRWILHNHQEAKSEWALSSVIDGTLHNLIIDRTFVDKDGIRWIIDYKTSTFSQDECEDFLIKEQEKYLSKMQLYSNAIKILDKRPIKLGLYFPALPAWKEWGE